MSQHPTKPLGIDASRIGIRDLAYQTLRDAIVGGQFAPGAAVTEGQLAQELNISRTPLREALLRLESDSLLTRAPNGRLFVTEVSPREAIDLYSVRIVLEELAIVDAIAHAPPGFPDELEGSLASFRDLAAGARPSIAEVSFHGLIHDASRNPINRRLIRQLHVVSDRYAAISVRHHTTRRSEAEDEHLAILEAVRQQDEVTARQAVRHHLVNVCETVVSALGGVEEFAGDLERLRGAH